MTVKCNECQLPIIDQAYIVADRKKFHPNCFITVPKLTVGDSTLIEQLQTELEEVKKKWIDPGIYEGAKLRNVQVVKEREELKKQNEEMTNAYEELRKVNDKLREDAFRFKDEKTLFEDALKIEKEKLAMCDTEYKKLLAEKEKITKQRDALLATEESSDR